MNIYTEQRPWGKFSRFTLNEVSTVKLLYVKKGEETSLQYHHEREEFWHVVQGHPEVTVGEKIQNLQEGEDIVVEKGELHRIHATVDDVVILEISKGHFDENDIVRVQDDYNR